MRHGVWWLVALTAACGEEAGVDVDVVGAGEEATIDQGMQRVAQRTHRISAGAQRTCWIFTNGDVRCAGSGPLGNGDSADHSSPVVVTGLHNVTDIAQADLGSGESRFFALRSDGTVWTWGDSAHPTPAQVTGLPKAAVQVSGASCIAGQGGCVVLVDGTVWGIADNIAASQVAGLSNIFKVVRDGAPCALTATGLVRCWGSNEWGTVGNGTTNPQATPLTVSGLSGVIDVDGGMTTCALLDTGAIKCWGRNTMGQVGNGSTSWTVNSPVSVTALGGKATQLGIGWMTSCALLSTGNVRCWGRPNLGNGTTTASSVPVTVSGVSSVSEVDAGEFHTCVITFGGPKCWGFNGAGELGNSTNTSSTVPTSMSGGQVSERRLVATGTRHTCSVNPNTGSVQCWGDNYDGQLGDWQASGAYSFIPVSATISGVVDIDAGANTTCAVKGDGTVWCWGCHVFSDYCEAAPIDDHPVQVPGITDAVAVRVHGTACVLKADGHVACWGLDSLGFGVLGDGTFGSSDTPVEVVGIDDAVAIDVTFDHACAILSLGSVRCWGSDYYSQLGNNSSTDSAVPVAAPLPSPALSIALPHAGTLVASIDGTLRHAGATPHGDGNGNLPWNNDTLTQVNGVTDAVDVAGGSSVDCFLTANGRVRCWGSNIHGERGDGGTTNDVLSPTEVKVRGLYGLLFPLQNVTSFSLGFDHGCAVTSSNNVYCWGLNDWGQIGDGTQTDAFTAKVVSGLN